MLRWIFAFVFGAAFLFEAPARAETYRLNYDAAVLGVVVLGEVSYEVTSTPTRYAVRANVRTSGAARIFDQTEITATSMGEMSGGAINWARYDISHAYSGKFRRTQMTRGASGLASTISPNYRDLGTPAATEAQRRGSYDPLTGVFALGRQVGVNRACRGSVLVFDGRSHYRLAVAPRAETTFSGGGYNGPALHCDFRYEPISGFSSSFNRSNVPAAQAWFALPSEPGFAPPLRIMVPTPVGAAQLDIRSYQRS